MMTIRQIAKKYAAFDQFFFLGRHYMFLTALEASLKLKEISYLNATAYPAGEMKHGPIALLDANLPVIGMLGNKRTYDKMLSNLMESKARHAPVLAFAPVGASQIASLADDVIWIPEVSDEFAPILYSVAGQLFAYYIALERGTEIDQPRNLAKSVTVEETTEKISFFFSSSVLSVISVVKNPRRFYITSLLAQESGFLTTEITESTEKEGIIFSVVRFCGRGG